MNICNLGRYSQPTYRGLSAECVSYVLVLLEGAEHELFNFTAYLFGRSLQAPFQHPRDLTIKVWFTGT